MFESVMSTDVRFFGGIDWASKTHQVRLVAPVEGLIGIAVARVNLGGSAPGATPHWTCIAANPPGHKSPPGTHGTGGKRSLPAGRPIRLVYKQDQLRTREGYRGSYPRPVAQGPPNVAQPSPRPSPSPAKF